MKTEHHHRSFPTCMQAVTGLLALTGAGVAADGPATRYQLGRRARLHNSTQGAPVVPMAQTVPVVPTLPTTAGVPNVQDALAAAPACVNATHPKAALMFLSRGPMPHEAAWGAWLKTARHLQPKATATDLEEVARGVRPPTCPQEIASDADPIAAQDLFSVYVHAAPEFKFDERSMFAERRIDARIHSGWGEHALIDAERALVQAALADPRNERFVLLSESGIPLYPADTLYQQLMHEDKSRINACFHDGSDVWRWHPAMGRDNPSLPQSAWRKSPQWFTLTRKHAEVFSNDTAIDGVFRRHCEHRAYDEELKKGYHCYSDEHYLPVLLSEAQLGHETDCVGKSVSADWSKGGASPRTYSARETRAPLVMRLRHTPSCHAQTAIDLAPQMFLSQGAGTAATTSAPAWDPLWLHGRCPLFARKFSPEAAGAVWDLMTDCDNGLQLTRC